MSDTPVVITEIEGGSIFTTTVRGEVNLFEFDWDVLEDPELTPEDALEEKISVAEAIPVTVAERARILKRLRDALPEAHAWPGYPR